VGIIVLSAGIGNDVVGWILLALCVTLINSGASLTALWILLVCIGYCVFIAFPVRWAFFWLLRRTGSFEKGPTQAVVAITIMLVLASAFFTHIIGVHAIFGAFLIGLICPHGMFSIKLQEKIEDLVSVLFLPLYFALSGLNTNLGLLDSGIVWGYVIGVCIIALAGKIIGGTVAAKLNGLVWRESLAVGCLMSCKGLVELIVLNIGFQARILSQRTFTIFVVMALITTFTATPLVVWLYPPWYRTKLQLWKEKKIDWNGNYINHNDDDSTHPIDTEVLGQRDVVRKVLVYLRLDSLSSLFTMVILFARKEEEAIPLEGELSHEIAKGKEQERDNVDNPSLKLATSPVSALHRYQPLEIQGLRLMELTECESSVLKGSEIEEFTSRDPVIRAFSTFGHSQSNCIAVGGQISVAPDHSFSDEIVTRAHSHGSDFILLPWSETGTIGEYSWPFDTVPAEPLANGPFTNLATEVFRKAVYLCHVGVLLDWNVFSAHQNDESQVQDAHRGSRVTIQSLPQTRTTSLRGQHVGLSSSYRSRRSGRYRIIVPFIGSRDDLCAVRLGFQFARSNTAKVTILDLRTRAKNAIMNVENGVNAEFESAKNNLPTTINNCVSFVDGLQNSPPLDAIVAIVLQPTSRDTIVLIGRNWTYSGSTGDLSTENANTKSGSIVLGQLGTALVESVIEQSLSTALLVIQASRDVEGAMVGQEDKMASAYFPRKGSRASI